MRAEARAPKAKPQSALSYSGGMRAVLLLSILFCAPLSVAQENACVSGTDKSSPLSEPFRSPLTKRVMALKPNRPADKATAILLARAYFEYHLGGCGGESEPVEKGGRWVFSTKVGAGGRPGPFIVVDKRTGTTSAKGLPTVKDPSAYYGKPRENPWWLDQLLKAP